MKNLKSILRFASIIVAVAAFLVWNLYDARLHAHAQSPAAGISLAEPSIAERLASASKKIGGRPLRPRGDAAQEEEQARELIQIFDATRAAYVQAGDRENSAAQRRQIKLEWARELEQFLQNHRGSPYDADICLELGKAANVRSAYAKAISYYSRAWDATKDADDEPSPAMALEAAGELARLLAATGKLDLLDDLENEMRQRNKPPVGRGWWWALEVKGIARANPADYYKCGLWSLDKLGRLTQVGGFNSREIVETESSPNGFTAADLLSVANRAGLNANAVFVTDWARVPLPAVVHLTSEHFVVVLEKRGDFYGVNDPLLGTIRWLTLAELVEEASGCAFVHQNQVGSIGVRVLTTAEAATFRGRCHGPLPGDHTDPAPCTTCPCPPGTCDRPEESNNDRPVEDSVEYAPSSRYPKKPNRENGNGPCGSCGMAALNITEPYLNLWIEDTPLVYQPGNGPEVRLLLRYTMRRDITGISGEYVHGASPGLGWGGSWFSWVELSDDGYSAEVFLPSGAFAVFSFSGGSSTSDVSYRQNLKIEKTSVGGVVTSLKLLYPDGKIIEYGRKFDPFSNYYVFYMTKDMDYAGNYTTFSYNGSDLLTAVTASDTKTFTLAYDGTDTEIVTNIVASYGPTVSLLHGETDMGDGQYSPRAKALTTIIDPVNIQSRFRYWFFEIPYQLITPYGTTEFDLLGATNTTYGVNRTIRLTHPNTAQEFYLSINESPFTDWPSFSSEIPSGTPVGTLDTTERTNRNTFHWGIRQFEGLEATDYENLTWTDFKRARIRHWLANTAPIYTHFDTLSWEQDPSADGGTTAGQVTWYDYAGKGSYAFERGDQVIPSVVARVMPDGTTWYRHATLSAIGKPNVMIEKWTQNGTSHYRTNSYSYSADGFDIVEQRFGSSAGENKVVGYGYDPSHPHLPVLITNALNEVTMIGYDTSHRLVTYSPPSGLVTSNTFGADGLLAKTVEYHGSVIVRTNEFTWANGMLRTQTDARGLKITNAWDYLGRLTERKHPDGSTELFAYTNGAQVMTLDLTFYQNRLGITNTASFNHFRQPVYKYDGLGRVTAFGYCNCGTLLSLTNAYGLSNEVHRFTYDDQNHLTEHYTPSGSARTNVFDALGRVVIIKNGLGSFTNEYDNLNRRTVVKNEFGLVKGVGYDPDDRAVTTTNANGVITSATYDVLGRVRTRTYPDTGVEAFGYTANVASATSYTNHLSRVLLWAFDAGGRKTNEVSVGIYTNSFIYSAADDLEVLVDGKSQATTRGYNNYGQLVSLKHANGTTNATFSYDASGQLTNRWTAGKGNTAYTFDAAGNLLTVNYPTTADVTYQYDGLNQPTSEAVSGLFTSTFTYHPGGALKTEDGPFTSDTITYAINATGLRSGLSIQQPTGSFTNGYFFDSAARISSVVSHSGTYTYDYYPTNGGVTAATRLLRKVTLPSSAYITNSFDNNGRKARTRLMTSANAELNDHAYLYNVGGQRTQQTFTDDSYVTYAYDDAGELRTAYTTNSSGTEIAAQRYMYGYDAALNMTKRTNNATVSTYTINNLNQNITGYTYDANGNPNNNTNVSTGFIFDDENRLTVVELFQNWKVDFFYDARSRLRKRTEQTWTGSGWSSPVITQYVYDGLLVVQERNGGAGGAPLVTYTRGPDFSGAVEGAGGIGGLLARTTGYSSGTGAWTSHQYYHADGNGNVTYLMTSGQALAASYRYDPFGRTITSSGTSSSANTYRFSSKEIHTFNGYYYYGYRFYDPLSQRWLNRDPKHDLGFSEIVDLAAARQYRRSPGMRRNFDPLYSFAFNQPTLRFDPFGLDSPGCDGVPDQTEIPCVLECCAQHDECYQEKDCTASSWFCPLSPCVKCNAGAVICMVLNCITPPWDDPKKPNFYCCQCREFFDVPDDNLGGPLSNPHYGHTCDSPPPPPRKAPPRRPIKGGF